MTYDHVQESLSSLQGLQTAVRPGLSSLRTVCKVRGQWPDQISHPNLLTETIRRFRRSCEYEDAVDSDAARPPEPEPLFAPEVTSLSQLKNSIVRRLQPLKPEDFTAYSRSPELWFPVAEGFQTKLHSTWDNTSLDIALLCLSILLLTTIPSSSAKDTGNVSKFEELYLQMKSSLALAEGLGLNSITLVQTRILTTLFEVSHGFYPAAYISIGSTLRAADALEGHPTAELSPAHRSSETPSFEETTLMWCGILVLDV
jgi:hypothetical protein